MVYETKGMLQTDVTRGIQARSGPRLILFNSFINDFFLRGEKKECAKEIYLWHKTEENPLYQRESKD